MADPSATADPGAVYVAGAVTLTADEPAQQLLRTDDGSLSVAVVREGEQAQLTIRNASGVPLRLADGTGSLEPGDTVRSLPVTPSGAILALQAAADTGGAARLAATLFVSAEPAGDGTLVIGQLLARLFEPDA